MAKNKNRTSLWLNNMPLSMKNKRPDKNLIQNHLYTIKSQQKDNVITKYFV